LAPAAPGFDNAGTPMASKLTEVLTPGETVLFHAYWTGWEIAVRVLGFIVFALIFMATIMTLFGVEDWGGQGLLGVLFLAVMLIRRMARAEALVTNQRLLHRTGHKHPPLLDVTIADIRGIAHSPGILGFGSYLSANAGGKVSAKIALVPGLRQLWAVLAQQAGLPPPPAFGLGMRIAIHGSALFCVLAAFATLAGAVMVMIDWMGGDRHATATDWLVIVLLFIPAIGLAFLAGLLFAWISAAVLIRFFFTSAQARQIACMGYDGHRTGFEGRLMNWCLHFSGARFPCGGYCALVLSRGRSPVRRRYLA
jgi:hypothetical protein